MSKLFDPESESPIDHHIDPTELAADLSHQVVELNAQMENLKKENEGWRLETIRAKAVSDAFRQLIVELHIRP